MRAKSASDICGIQLRMFLHGTILPQETIIHVLKWVFSQVRSMLGYDTGKSSISYSLFQNERQRGCMFTVWSADTGRLSKVKSLCLTQIDSAFKTQPYLYRKVWTSWTSILTANPIQINEAIKYLKYVFRKFFVSIHK